MLSFRSVSVKLASLKMDFVKKVFAESDPADDELEVEDSSVDDEEEEEEDDSPFIEGPHPSDDCDCICFCEEKGDGTLISQNLGNLIRRVEEPEEEEEDLVDPQDELREQCTEKKDCQGYKAKLEECNARVEGKSRTSENCVEEIIDFMHCVDHCVSKTLFTKLK